LVWVCPHVYCPDGSKYQQGQFCKSCGSEVRDLRLQWLGRLLNFKRAIAAMEAETKTKWK
jgi:hypothetical protein